MKNRSNRSGTVTLFIQNGATGEVHPICVSKNQKINSLLLQTGKQQCIVCLGSIQLDTNCKFNDYQIEHGSTLRVEYRMLGGSKLNPIDLDDTLADKSLVSQDNFLAGNDQRSERVHIELPKVNRFRRAGQRSTFALSNIEDEPSNQSEPEHQKTSSLQISLSDENEGEVISNELVHEGPIEKQRNLLVQNLPVTTRSETKINMQDFLSKHRCDSQQGTLLDSVVQTHAARFKSSWQSFEACFDSLLPHLTLIETCKIIVALGLSSMTKKLNILTVSQKQLLMLLKSAKKPEFIDFIGNSLHDVSLTAGLKAQLAELTEGEQLYQLLFQQSDVAKNQYLWRLLKPIQMIEIAFDHADGINFHMLRNCTHNQIDQLFQLYRSLSKSKYKQQIERLETAYAQIVYHPVTKEEMKLDLEQFTCRQSFTKIAMSKEVPKHNYKVEDKSLRQPSRDRSLQPSSSQQEILQQRRLSVSPHRRKFKKQNVQLEHSRSDEVIPSRQDLFGAWFNQGASHHEKAKPPEHQFQLSHPLICIKLDGQSSEVNVQHLVQEDHQFIKFSFQSEIIALGQIFSSKFRPGFCILTVNKSIDEAFMTQVTFKKAYIREEWSTTENVIIKTKVMSQLQLQAIKSFKERQILRLSLFELDYENESTQVEVLQAENAMLLLGQFVEGQRLIDRTQPLKPLRFTKKYLLFVAQDPVTMNDQVKSLNLNIGNIRLIYETPKSQILQWHLNNSTLFILDTNLILRQISIDGNLQVVWSKVRNLQQFPSLDEFRDSLTWFNLQLTDSCFSVFDQLYSLETGDVLPQANNMPGKLLEVLPNMVLLLHQNNRLQVSQNPASRELRLGDDNLWQNVRSLHTLAPDRLLIQLQCDGWLMMNLDGAMLDMPQELQNMLSYDDSARSCVLPSAQCQLILDRSENEGKVVLLELQESGNVAIVREVNLEEKIPLVQILFNFQGEVLLVSAANQGPDLANCSPSVVRHEYPDVYLIHFETAHDALSTTYAGHYFCWVDKSAVQVYDLTKGTTRTIDISGFLQICQVSKERDQEYLTLEACDTRSLIETGWLYSITKSRVDQLANHLQVTFHENVMVYNLNLEKPCLYDEIDDIYELYCPNKFIEVGFKLTRFDENHKQVETGVHIQQMMLSQSSFRNVIIETQNELVHRVYRKYTLEDVKVAEQMICGQKLNRPTLWATFGHLNVLSQMTEDFDAMNTVFEHFNSAESQSRDVAPSTADMRRLNYLMIKRTMFMNPENDIITAQSLLSGKLIKNSSQRDILLSIGLLSPDFSLVTHFSSQQCFKKVTRRMTDQLIEALNKSLQQKPSMKKIKVIDWPESGQIDEPVTFLSDSIDMTQDKLEAVLNKLAAPGCCDKFQNSMNCCRKKTFKTRKRPVEVLMLDLRWLFRHRQTFVGLSTLLEDLPNSFYASEFTQNLTKQFWNAAQRRIIIEQALPYGISTILIIRYYASALQMGAESLRNDERYDRTWFEENAKIESYVVAGCLGYLIITELRQFRINPFKNLQSGWNWLDWINIGATIQLVYKVVSEQIPDWEGNLTDDELWELVTELRMIAAASSLILIFKVYNWMRVFQSVSHFYQLIQRTIGDIQYFLALYLFALLAFAIPMWILNNNNIEPFHVHQTVISDWINEMYEASGHQERYINSSEENSHRSWYYEDEGRCADDMTCSEYQIGQLVKHHSPQTSLGTDAFADSTVEGIKATFWSFPNMLFNQYLISLGEFENLGNYGNRYDRVVTHLLFIGSTLGVQVILFNMLIAIMGDSFDYATDNKQAFCTRAQLEVLQDNAALLTLTTKKEQENVFMVLLRPLDDADGDEANWNGKIDRIITLTKEQLDHQAKELGKRHDRLSSDIEAVHKKVQHGQLEMKAKMTEMDSKMNDMERKISDISIRSAQSRNEVKATVVGIENKMATMGSAIQENHSEIQARLSSLETQMNQMRSQIEQQVERNNHDVRSEMKGIKSLLEQLVASQRGKRL